MAIPGRFIRGPYGIRIFILADRYFEIRGRDSAAALRYNLKTGRSLLFIRRQFFKYPVNVKNWVVWHEIGHHLTGHPLGPGDDIELEADVWAANKMGVEIALKAMKDYIALNGSTPLKGRLIKLKRRLGMGSTVFE